MNDSKQTILSSARRFFSGTLLSRLLGFGRELFMATAFGTAPEVAAFWMAYRFIYLLRRLFGEGALHSAFIPHYESLKKERPEQAAAFFVTLTRSLTQVMSLFVGAIMLLLCLFWLFGAVSDANRQIITLTLLMLPASLFICLYALNQAVLNCESSFFLPSVAPAVVNLLWIIAVLLFAKKPLPFAMQGLACFLLLALFLQWVITLPKILPLWRSASQDLPPLYPILRPFLFTLVGVTATQINSALDTIFARIADPEGPAYLWYAIRLQQLPLSLFSVALAGALLPPLTRAVQAGEQEKIQSFLCYARGRICLVMLPITLGTLLLARWAITWLYGYGKFGPHAISQTTACLQGYGAGLVPMSLILIYVTAYTARKNYLFPAYAALISVGVNVGLNTLFVFKLNLGAPSIAYATSLSALVNILLLSTCYGRETRTQEGY